jgi:hypothetical protein
MGGQTGTKGGSGGWGQGRTGKIGKSFASLIGQGFLLTLFGGQIHINGGEWVGGWRDLPVLFFYELDKARAAC